MFNYITKVIFVSLSIYIPVIRSQLHPILNSGSFSPPPNSIRTRTWPDKRKEGKSQQKRVGQFLEMVEYKTFSLIARLASKPNMLNPNEVRNTPVNASM